MPGRRLTTDHEIAELLRGTRSIAVVGLSPESDRDSHRVAVYLQRAGYRIIPVHPRGGTILGEHVFPTLAAALGEGVPDLIDVFRQPAALPGIVDEAIAGGATRLWFQLGVVHPDAEEKALAHGLELVADRCIAVEHRRLSTLP